MLKPSERAREIKLFDLVAYWDKNDEKDYYGFVEELQSNICKIFWFDYEILPNAFYYSVDALEYRNRFLESIKEQGNVQT